MTSAEEFEQLRPLLFSIAYRILGSVSEAEDAVQETWLRLEASSTQPTSTKAFLSAAWVGRGCTAWTSWSAATFGPVSGGAG